MNEKAWCTVNQLFINLWEVEACPVSRAAGVGWRDTGLGAVRANRWSRSF